jgi:hypothetical protein
LLVSLAVGLCMSARGGDQRLNRQLALTPLVGDSPWEPVGTQLVTAATAPARGRAGTSREGETSHRRGRVGVAA